MFRGALLLSILLLMTHVNAADDDKVLRDAGLADDDTKLIDYFRRRVVTDADRQTIKQLIVGLGHDSFPERERATAELIKWGFSAVSQLREAKRSKDAEVAKRAEVCLKRIENVPGSELSAAAVRALAKKKPSGSVEALLVFLPHADDESVADEIREALAALAPAGGSGDPVLLKALDDPIPQNRATAGEALIRAGIMVARKLTADPDPEVRLRAILALVTHVKDKSAVSHLIDQLVDAPQQMVWRAEDVLVRLAGEQSPQVSLGKDDATRKLCRDAWANWWREAAANVDLNQLAQNPATLGYTLIVEGEPRAPYGRVYEVNDKGEIIWKIENLMQPSDAMVVGKDRVLIAESNSYQISLRDFRGNVLPTTKQMTMPHSLQLLSDKRYLVAGRSNILEVNEKLAEVFNYQRDSHDIMSACKTAKGEYWFITQMGKCVRLDGQKKEIKTFDLVGMKRTYSGFVGMSALPNGHVLIATQNMVKEYAPDGGPLAGHFEFQGQLSSAQRLANGNTLIAGLNDRRIVEIDRNKETIWEYRPPDTGIPRKARRR